MTSGVYCARCEEQPCACPPMQFDPEFEPLEHERPGFEAYIREVFPRRDLTRYAHTYRDNKVADRWLGWQAKARRTPNIYAGRVLTEDPNFRDPEPFF